MGSHADRGVGGAVAVVAVEPLHELEEHPVAEHLGGQVQVAAARVLLVHQPVLADRGQQLRREVKPGVEVVARDFPFLGACYGVGTLGGHQGGIVDRTYTEPLSCVSIELTAAGAEDPLLAGVPERFDAFVGHKEACRVLPPSAVLLATSAACPVQMFRVKQNVYATQFHPELDAPGICARARVYQHYGYFPPDELDALIGRLSQGLVTEPGRLLKNFVARYA